MNRLKLLVCACAVYSVIDANAQRNFYHRLDVGSANVYTFVLSNLLTGYANYLSGDMLFDNSYVYTLYDGSMDGGKIRTKGFNPMGITATELFNDAFAGVKLGYQSDRLGFLNWGVFASGHYRINQVQAMLPVMEDFGKERFQYVKTGGGLLLTLGSMENRIKVQLEAAARYDMPVGYSGICGTAVRDALNSGISTHFSVKVAGYSWFSAGVFGDFCHYDLYKDVVGDIDFRPYSLGVVFTITPKRGEDVYE